MAIMHIAEYERLARDSEGNILQAGEEPATTTQAVTFTTTVASAAFRDSTRFVRISLDGAGFVKFGVTPTATTAVDTPMAANVPEYFGVRPQSVDALAVAAVT